MWDGYVVTSVVQRRTTCMYLWAMRALGLLVDGRRCVFAENVLPDAASDREANERLTSAGTSIQVIEPFYGRVATEHDDLSRAVPRNGLCSHAGGRFPCLHAGVCSDLPSQRTREAAESDLLGNRVYLDVDLAVHRSIRSVVPIAQRDGRALSRNVGVYRDIFHGTRYAPAPMIDFIDCDE